MRHGSVGCGRIRTREKSENENGARGRALTANICNQGDYTMASATGWAVQAQDEVIVNTVAATSRAALVNWLAVACDIAVTKYTSDTQIYELWDKHKGEETILVEVIIHTRLPQVRTT
jgi:hypothetical protein